MPKKRQLVPMDLQVFAEPGGEGGEGKGGYSAAYVQELRDEAAGWRTKLRTTQTDYEKLERERDDAKNDLDTLQAKQKQFLDGIGEVLKLDTKELDLDKVSESIKSAISNSDEPMKKAGQALIKASFMASAIKSGIRKEALDDAYKVADFTNVKADLEKMEVYSVDKDGKRISKDGKEIVGLDDLTTALVKDKPWFTGKSGSIGGPSNPKGQEDPDEESYGTRLGKRQREIAKKQAESQEHYFSS